MKHRALALLTVVTVAACSGSTGPAGSPGQDGAAGAAGAAGANGATGPTGPAGANGQDLTATAKPESCEVCHSTAGADHQALYNAFKNGADPAKTQLAIKDLAITTTAGTTAGTFKSTATFKILKGGLPFTGTPAQKTLYFVSYDDVANKFTTAPYKQDAASDPTGEIGGLDASSPVNFSYGSLTLKDAATGEYTMVKDNLSADPLTANANAFVYGYFGDSAIAGMPPNKPGRRYSFMNNLVSVAQVVRGAIGYTSTIKVSNCENCHGKPYSKHGVRQATVAGLNDFVACKACHTDQRRGTDGAWYLLVDDPATYAAESGNLTDAQKAKYAYTANVMNDTHNSHAFEFAYPQSMANCVSCHDSTKLNLVLTDANFTLATCKSCHPATGVGGTSEKRAPALKDVLPPGLPHTMDLYTYAGACNNCHKAEADGGFAPTFAQIHSGYDKAIYAADGSKYAGTVKAQIDSAAFDSATKKLTVQFSVAGAAANAVVKPTVVVSLYGWDTKDFVVTGHGSQPAPDGKRNLEWTEGASGNSPRLTVVAGASAGSFVATADLTTWASKLADGSVKRAEIGVLPVLGLNQTAAVNTDPAKGALNPAIAVAGVTRTFDLVANALLAPVAENKKIVSADKCNACHNALGTTFHSPSYGSASVVACRLCHVGLSGGSHLEMQSRSIDSYVHAIHSFQAFDVSGINFADPVAALEYEEHVDSTYPNFTTLSCESCHNAGTYEVPDQSKSLPGLLSKAATLTGKDRSIGALPAYTTGPASRACGSCHRAEMINEDDAGKLAAFNAHTDTFGFMLAGDSATLDAAIAKIMAQFK